jgi:hypothetical protein
VEKNAKHHEQRQQQQNKPSLATRVEEGELLLVFMAP